MDALDIASGVLFLIGAVLSVTGSVGIVRMPDFYARLHPAGKTDTAGQFMILSGLVLQAPDWVTGAKLLLVIGLLAVSAPTASHAITKAAWLAGLRPWTNRPEGHALNCPGSIPLSPDRPAETSMTSMAFPSDVAVEASSQGQGEPDTDVSTEPGSSPPATAEGAPEGAAP